MHLHSRQCHPFGVLRQHLLQLNCRRKHRAAIRRRNRQSAGRFCPKPSSTSREKGGDGVFDENKEQSTHRRQSRTAADAYAAEPDVRFGQKRLARLDERARA